MASIKTLLVVISVLSVFYGTVFAKETVTIDKVVYELNSPNQYEATIIESRLPTDSPAFATLSIPDEIDVDGSIYTVREINENVFKGCAIEKLIIPGTIMLIKKDAFAYCSRLKEVVLESGKRFWDKDKAIKIMYPYFIGCPIERVSLGRNISDFDDGYDFQLDPERKNARAVFGTNVKQLEIGSNATYIRLFCFWNCQSLATVTIPGTVQELGGSSFGRTNLKEVVYEAGDTPLIWGNLGAHSIEHLTLNRNFKSGNFGGCNINEIEIGPDVTRIDNNLFRDCSNLESIKIPGNVKSIGVAAFEYCKNLSEVIFEEGLTEIEERAFYGCTNLQSINLPVELTEIGTSAFSGCTNLKSVTIPEGVAVLERTFSGCNYLERVNLPSSLQTIGEGTFYACYNLEPFDLPSNLSAIGERAFGKCEKMTNIAIPPSVKSIGKGAFVGIPLTSVYIENSPTYITLDQIFTHDKEGTDTTQLDWFHLGRNVEFEGLEDGPNVFSQCHLKNFTMSAEVTVIPEYFFSGWTEATWPGLASFKLPEGVEELKRKCFENCTGLKELILPPAVKKIGINAFIDCSLEKLMVMSPEPPQCSPYAFDDDQYANIELVVPTESFELYKSTAPWSKFAKIRGSEFTSIDSVEATGEAPVEWYDLRGMKVSGENMPAGIYLRRQGAKVEKVVIR